MFNLLVMVLLLGTIVVYAIAIATFVYEVWLMIRR